MEERIIMTPRGKTATSTILQVERRKLAEPPGTGGSDVHVGGGQHSGIIVNKTNTDEPIPDTAPQLQLEFKVFLVNAATKTHTTEARILRFWFRQGLQEGDQAKSAQEFFKELVAPLDFPRDYVGYIKKIMKMLQHGYSNIVKIEVELRQIQVADAPPTQPNEVERELCEEEVLEVIESAYPNPVTVVEMAKATRCTDHKKVRAFISALETRGVIKSLEHESYTRIVHNDTDVQIVRQMPKMVSSKQPTIAIITAQYCEKLAVDSMIDNQETFVRYTTVGSSYGESNIYTLGHIGGHRVVCTKLPQVGHDRSALIAAGGTTTRLLGTFQHVDHVFLVGVAGGVPHYTDYTKHVRLGDVVVASPNSKQNKHIYLYCEGASVKENGEHHFECKSWGPPDLTLQQISATLKQQAEDSIPQSSPWLQYMVEGEKVLREMEMDFSRPADDTDRLYMGIGGSDVIQVTHPSPPTGAPILRTEGQPRIHTGLIASGRCVTKDPTLHQDFASQLGVLAYDQEMDAVIDSVYGNRKDTYTVIRGVADYRDGSQNREWQPHASLAAAAFTKAVICSLDTGE